MAEAGQAKMVDAQTKSLVSEQYLDGWPLDDKDEDESESENAASAARQEKGGSVKRSHTEEETPTENKKMCISLKSKWGTSEGAASGAKKITVNLGGSASKLKAPAAPIKLNLSSAQAKQETSTLVKKTSSAVAKAFGEDSDESEEEMPPEARMRMRNIGRETPTAAGPNSFGKGRLGFCDRQKIVERELQQKSEGKK